MLVVYTRSPMSTYDFSIGIIHKNSIQIQFTSISISNSSKNSNLNIKHNVHNTTTNADIMYSRLYIIALSPSNHQSNNTFTLDSSLIIKPNIMLVACVNLNPISLPVLILSITLVNFMH